MLAEDNRDIAESALNLLLPDRGSESLCLTILFHPDISRIGEVALLDDLRGSGAVALGRNSPSFGPLGGQVQQPLQDARISRTAIDLAWSNDRLQLDASCHSSPVFVAGRKLDNHCLIDAAELRRGGGVTILLARCVVLQLHYAEQVASPIDMPELVGESAAMRRVRGLVEKVAPRDVAVLLTGESGTGKELVARALHRFGRRQSAELVTVNMAALPAELASAELFGVRRGAYTGADADRLGYLQQAHCGTLFLDEIAECPRNVQTQLLRVLQEGEVQPVGGGIKRVDVRFIAATDARIADANSGFSNALRHRLGGFEVHLPPLRERREDIGRLMALGLSEPLSALSGGESAVMRWAVLFDAFTRYHWPGNVRELFNACQQVALATGSGDHPVVPDVLRKRLWQEVARPDAGAAGPRRAVGLSDVEVRDALLQARWEVSRAARALAISRQSLYNRIQSIPGLRVAADIPVAEIEAVHRECDGQLEAAAARLQVSAIGLRQRWRALELPSAD